MTLLGLRPVAFRYVQPYGDPAVPQAGPIAEEVVRVYPEAVALDAAGRTRKALEAEVARLAEVVEFVAQGRLAR